MIARATRQDLESFGDLPRLGIVAVTGGVLQNPNDGSSELALGLVLENGAQVLIDQDVLDALNQHMAEINVDIQANGVPKE